MKAVIVRAFAPFDQAEYGDLPDPVPGKGEVLVRVHAAEANYPDILVMEGAYQVKPPLPFSPGKAAAGIVEKISPDVTGFAPGDRVAVEVEYGAYAEKLLCPAETCYPLPDSLSFEVGAALGLVYQTAHFSLIDRADFKAGESVLVLGGSGGIGMASIQLAKAFGASTVIAGVHKAAHAEIAERAGADHVIDLGMENLRDGLRDRIRPLTGGSGVDVVIDPVGGEANAAALRAMAWRGRLVVVGFASGQIPAIKANYLLVKNIAVSGIQWSDYRERDPAWVADVQRQIFDLAVAGRIDPLISRVLPLADYAEALRLLKAGEARGKIVLSC